MSMFEGLQVGDRVTHDGVELIVGWRAVHPDLRSSHGFRWPFPVAWAEAPDPVGLPSFVRFTMGDPCPEFPGDGLCVAKTWVGAGSGGIPALCALLVAYAAADVLGEDADKVRVRRALVLDVFDPPALLRAGFGREQNLYGANLRGSDLRGSDLRGSDLRDSDLRGSDLSGVDLRGSDLRDSDLSRANLSGALGVPVDAQERGAVL